MKSQSIVLAGGCFWGVEELIRKVPGVLNTEVGYAGGLTENPTYETVKTGTTRHAEAVRIDFDTDRVSVEDLLRLFFQLHDPTTRNQQGNDIGTQYRSTIFYENEAERTSAEKIIAEENASGRHKRPLSTTIESLKRFYSAEAYHQDYLQKNPGGYNCHYWRRPDL